MDFSCTFSKSYSFFFLDFLKKIILFTLKNLFFTMKDAQSFVKIIFLVTFFTFLSVIRQKFGYNLRILANFRIELKNLRISLIRFQ